MNPPADDLNSYGTHSVTLDAWLAALDALPAKLRHRIDHARIPIVPFPFLKAYERGMPTYALLAVIDDFEAETVRSIVRKTYGLAHPEAA